MVFGLCGYGTRLAVLLQSTEDVGISLLSGDCPIAHLRLGVALVWSVFALLLGSDIMRLNGLETLHRGQLPCSRTVGDEGIGEQDYGSEMLHGNLGCLIGSVETVGGTQSGNHRHRALAVASVECLQQVGLLTLGGKSCRWTTTLNVDDHQGKFVDDGEVESLRLQTDAGT